MSKFPKVRPSIRSVAKRAGVSVATVSRIINGMHGRASPDTVLRVKQAVVALDYRPQSAGRALRQRESRIVGVLVANLGNPAMAAVAASIEAALRAHGYVMALCDTHEDAEIQDEYLREMEAQLARVIVMVVAVPSPMLDQLRQAGRPLVFVNRRDPGNPLSCFVGIDDLAAGRAVGAFCLQERFTHPAVLHASVRYSAGALRLRGIREEMSAAGWSLARIPDYSTSALQHVDIGYHAAAKAMAANPDTDVLICLSDLLAYGAYRWVCEHLTPNARRPRLISFDGNPLNDSVSPWLTSIRLPYEELGTGVVRALEDCLGGVALPEYLLPFQLVVRDVHPTRAGQTMP